MRTLVVSDLHLGASIQHSVLARPEPLERLLAAVDGVDRLVLLGDIVELLERDPARAMEAAEATLRAIGARVGREREVVLVPGNHDVPLIAAWVRARPTELTVDTPIPLNATAALAAVTGWLSPAQVRVHYPGVWLSDRVWATHGHYVGRRVGRRARKDGAGVQPIDYERASRGLTLHRIEAGIMRALPGPAATLTEDVAELARALTMPLPRRLLHRRMSALTSALLAVQVRRSNIPTLANVAASLGVDADWILFGHVHRLGPLAGDRLLEWQGPRGRPSIANTGSWVYEPLLVHHATPPHPYWPGGSVLLEDERPPVARGLLDDLAADALH
ncbi:MAG: metallophosphoesterase family protein [Solirubrobacterales bacterium]|nr:metallophosphoesterase family protein [Solirubrobacterales bacterium]